MVVSDHLVVVSVTTATMDRHDGAAAAAAAAAAEVAVGGVDKPKKKVKKRVKSMTPEELEVSADEVVVGWW